MKTARRKDRKSFSKIDAQWNLQIPNLLEVQLKSFRDFLQMDIDPMRRRNEGLQEVFTGVFPISDPRELFADWLITPENPWFTRAIANRAWSWLMVRGIIHEPDDIRPDNPPSNPELLALLEKELAAPGRVRRFLHNGLAADVFTRRILANTRRLCRRRCV